MKPYHILKDFNGSQTGLDFHPFKGGTVSNLSDSLAVIAVREGWAEPVTPEAVARETKVTGPGETKPLDLSKLDEKALAKHAKDNLGLKLNAKLTKDELLAAIEAHTAEKSAA